MLCLVKFDMYLCNTKHNALCILYSVHQCLGFDVLHQLNKSINQICLF